MFSFVASSLLTRHLGVLRVRHGLFLIEADPTPCIEARLEDLLCSYTGRNGAWRQPSLGFEEEKGRRV